MICFKFFLSARRRCSVTISEVFQRLSVINANEKQTVCWCSSTCLRAVFGLKHCKHFFRWTFSVPDFNQGADNSAHHVSEEAVSVHFDEQNIAFLDHGHPLHAAPRIFIISE